MSLNISLFIGRLTKDIELKKSQSGKSVVSFTVACNRDFGNDETDFINCVAWGKLAENMSAYCYKGMQVAVQGRIQTRSYDDPNVRNKKVYVTEIICNSVQFLESKNKGNNSQQEPLYDDTPTLNVTSDDLPF